MKRKNPQTKKVTAIFLREKTCSNDSINMTMFQSTADFFYAYIFWCPHTSLKTLSCRMQSLTVKITQNLKINTTTHKLHCLMHTDIYSSVTQRRSMSVFLHARQKSKFSASWNQHIFSKTTEAMSAYTIQMLTTCALACTLYHRNHRQH